MSNLDKENAETVVDAIEMIRTELIFNKPKRNILSNGIKLLVPIIAVANGFPVLATNI